MPPSLIVFAVFTIAASNFFTKKFYSPLNRIEHKICAFIGTGGDTYKPNSTDASDAVNNTNSTEILELRHLEIFLQKTFELVQEKRAVEQELFQIAAQAAHDIRSPIMALDLALQSIPNITEVQRKYVRNIEKSITHIAKELMHKYDVIKDRNQQMELIANEKGMVSVLIYDLVKDVFAQKKPYLEKNKITFTLHLQQEAQNIYVLVNPSFMQRILSNIINNAVDAIVARELVINEGVVDVSLEKHGQEVVITISDNGCGMSSELVEKIGHGEYSVGKKDGHGLGLYYAIHHIKTWHGTYSIDTKLNVGTSFKICLKEISNR